MQVGKIFLKIKDLRIIMNRSESKSGHSENGWKWNQINAAHSGYKIVEHNPRVKDIPNYQWHFVDKIVS